VEVGLHLVRQQRLVIRLRLLPIDIRQLSLDQHSADVLVLELDAAVATPLKRRLEPAAVLDLAEVNGQQFLLQHVKVIRHQGGNLFRCPILGYFDDLEAQFAEDMNGLAGGNTAAELFGLQHASQQGRQASPMTAFGE